MKKKELVDYLKKRWERVHKIEVKELRETSIENRFKQILVMFALGKELNLPTKKTEPESCSIIRWQQLKNYYHASK